MFVSPDCGTASKVMKRLLIFHTTIAPYRVDFFNALSEAFDMKLCLRYENLLEQRFDDYQSILDRCCFKPVYMKSLSWKSRVLPLDIVSHIKSFKPDIVMGLEYAFEVLAALAYKKATGAEYKVLTLSDDSFNMVAEDNDFTRLHTSLRTRVAPKLDDILLTSPAVTAWYREHYGKGFCFPIMRNEIFARKEYESAIPLSQTYIGRYGLEGKTVFLYAGRLVAVKCVDDIVKAFRKASLSDSVLVIVGGGERESSLRELAGQSENIIFTGRLEGKQLQAWYNIASAFILASRLEPFGAVTNEALIGGCDVIISRQCGSSCLVKEGINGHLFDTGDVASLANLMKLYSPIRVDNNAFPRPCKMTESFQQLFIGLKDHLEQLS